MAQSEERVVCPHPRLAREAAKGEPLLYELFIPLCLLGRCKSLGLYYFAGTHIQGVASNPSYSRYYRGWISFMLS